MKGYKRIEDGYKTENGRATITDNGGGMGPSKDSGRWAVSIDGKWVANIDTLREAVGRVTIELARGA